MKTKRDERLERIYDASLRVFALYGFKRTRVEDIADELGMTKGNIYLYAKNKRDLYEKAVAFGLVRWQTKAVNEIMRTDDVVEQFSIYALKGLEYLMKDRDLRSVLINDPAIFPISPKEDAYLEINQASMEMLKDILRRGIREGRFNEFDVDHVARLFYSMYIMFVIKTYVKAEGQSTIRMFEEGIDLILHGMLK